MVKLFDRDYKTIRKHINNALSEELDISAVAKFETVQKECNRELIRDIKYYNLDMIISVGKNNRYGHSNKEVLNTLDNSNIYRTDHDGSIIFNKKIIS